MSCSALLEELYLKFHWLDKLSENEQDELAASTLDKLVWLPNWTPRGVCAVFPNWEQGAMTGGHGGAGGH